MAPGGISPASPAKLDAKRSALSALLHRRQAWEADGQEDSCRASPMPVGYFARNDPGALGELQQNQQDAAPRSPLKLREERRREDRHEVDREGLAANNKTRGQASPKKPKKTKSGTNLAALLTRPKSLKNLYRLATEDDGRSYKDKENRTPDGTSYEESPPPIFAQFTSDTAVRQQREKSSADETTTSARPRPQSFQIPPQQRGLDSPSSYLQTQSIDAGSRRGPVASDQTLQGKLGGALGHARSKSTATSPTSEFQQSSVDPKEIDKQLEALLDRRNIPENQRYKMRNLNDTVKMEFIRQDWAEMQAAKLNRATTQDSSEGVERSKNDTDGDEDRPKRSRGRSFTFSRAKKDSNSPTKKTKGEGASGRHLRSKSTENVALDRPSSSGSGAGASLLSKMKLQQGPGDYVAYLRKVQKPELVEVGKLHKLRLLLRNETVAWIEAFIQQGGMGEIVSLLNRTMGVEWREEHEDALLHENLLCLKALSTTAKAMEHLHSVQGHLFPKLLHLLFDPERKGPSEFTTRNIITSVLLTYIESATPGDRVSRARSVLDHLRDQQPGEGERPLPFVLEMRQERPYKMWCKEVVSVTKEVFWIFLHNLNVVALPTADQSARAAAVDGLAETYAYMKRHFPQERPPIPAAPYVGGVEWDATNYLASHLDLMNAIVACMPSLQERNDLRAQFRISGWERCLGGSLRLCKEKFYGSVHAALRTWVAAAAEDGWDVKDVRYGPPPDARGSPRKAIGPVKVVDVPQLDMPKLDLGLDKPSAARDAWL